MEQEIRLTNEEFSEIDKKLSENSRMISEIEDKQQVMREDLDTLKSNRVLDEDTLELIMGRAIKAGLSDVMDKIATQDERIRELEIDKFKTSHSTLRWFFLTAGAVIIAFIITAFINAVVN